ncbi:MAG: SET domain-containing protein [Acidobacteriota bacterium]|nr:SET domain-containing protein [Acidobacteriota bacterium]
MPAAREDLKVKRSSAGLGLFSLRRVPAGRRIIEFVGRVVPAEEARGKYLFDLGGGLALDGRSRPNPARYLNHSCRPNAEARISGRRVWVWSRRAIRAGEEITLDYGPEYFDEHIRPVGCKCAACTPQMLKKKART